MPSNVIGPGNPITSPKNFDKKESFPKIFQATDKVIRVYKDGRIEVSSINDSLVFIESLPELYKAVEVSKKLNELHASSR